ncbi:MAG: hypothetical protein ACXWHZ_03515 [Usitatibacter sp.]
MTDYSQLSSITLRAMRVAQAQALEPPPAVPLPTDRPVVWQDVVDSWHPAYCAKLLKEVLRSRKRTRIIGFGPKMETFTVTRNELRDYLRQRGLPRWLRSRPIPASKSGTVKFRRYIPYGEKA